MMFLALGVNPGPVVPVACLRAGLSAAKRSSLSREARARAPMPVPQWRKNLRRVTFFRRLSRGCMSDLSLGDGFVEVQENVGDHGPGRELADFRFGWAVR